VVGVIADEKVGGLDDKPENNPGMYVSNEQSPVYYQAVLVHGAGDTALLREPIRRAIHEISRDQVLPDMKTLDVIKAESLGDSRFRVMLLGIFAGVSLLLSAIGIYGVISYSVTQRTREIGIRTALGASGGQIIRLVLRHAVLMASAGIVAGLVLAAAGARLLSGFLFGVSARDPLTFAAVPIVLLAVAAIACVIPARRAARVDPLTVLRSG
jgi:putative ABC transport system permease protein